MKSKYLTKDIQKAIQEYVKTIEIDVCELDSYKYYPAVSSESRWASPEDSEWDEDEELLEQYKTFAKWVEADGIEQYLDGEYFSQIPGLKDDPDDWDELNSEVLDYINWCIDYIEEELDPDKDFDPLWVIKKRK